MTYHFYTSLAVFINYGKGRPQLFCWLNKPCFKNINQYINRWFFRMVLITLFFFAGGTSSAQGMPVYDNTNFLSLAKQLIESAKQTSNLLKTVEFLKQQKENIEKVNRVVQQLQAVRELTENHQRLYETIRTDVRAIIDSPFIHSDEAERTSSHFEAMIQLSLSDLDFIDQVLSSNLLRMSDNDRTQLLQKKEQQSRELLAQVNTLLQRYRDIIAFREFQEMLNTRNIIY